MTTNRKAGVCRNGNCSKHQHRFHIGEEVFGKLGMALAAAALGGKASKHPMGALVGFVLGGLVGHAIDENVLPTCPECGVALRIINTAI